MILLQLGNQSLCILEKRSILLPLLNPFLQFFDINLPCPLLSVTLFQISRQLDKGILLLVKKLLCLLFLFLGLLHGNK